LGQSFYTHFTSSAFFCGCRKGVFTFTELFIL